MKMAAPMEGAIENYIKGLDDSGVNDILAGLTSGNTKLVDVTECLGKYLTNSETSTRARGTRLLADVLNKLDTSFLTQKECDLLTVYLSDRLRDHHSLQPPALLGFTALSQCQNLADGGAEKMCRVIFSDVHTQSLPQGDRRSVFTIFINLLNTRLAELQKLGTDFVYGFVQAMDAEKDPRNLVLAFTCAHTIIQNFSLGVFTEEMFEVVSCYFPIDFSPSPTDPSGITKEDLITSLRRCLAATPKFAEHCLPLLMEKLTSDLKSAKIDSLLTLTACVQVFTAVSLQEFQSSFFNCIKKELFMSGDKDLEDAGLGALTALIKRLSTNVIEAGTTKNLDGLLEEIMSECKQHLLQPELMLMLSSGRLLHAVAMASDPACSQVLNFSIPLLLEAHGKKSEHSPRHNVLEVLVGLIGTTRNFKYSDDIPSPVLSYKSHVMALFGSCLSDPVPSIQRQGTLGFHTLLGLPGVLHQDDKVSVATAMVNTILNQTTEREIRLECNTSVRLLSTVSPDIVHSAVLPRLFEALNTETMDTDAADGSKGDNCASNVLEALSTLAVGPSIVEKVMGQQLIRLRSLLSSKDADTVIESQTTSGCIRDIAANNVGNERSLQYLSKVVAPDIFNIAVSYSQSSGTVALQDNTVLANLSATLCSIVSHLPDSEVQKFQTEVVNLYIEGNVSNFWPDIVHLVFQPFQLEANTQQILITLLTPVICTGSSKVQIPHLDVLLPRLLEMLKQSTVVGDVLLAVCKCFSGLINKHKEGEALSQVLTEVQGHFVTVIEGGASTEERVRALECWSWITKALVLRNHPLAQGFTDKMLGCLSCEGVGTAAAMGVPIILEEYEDVMSRKMGACIRLMYKQRFFQENLPKLVQGFSQSQPEFKKNYLLALSHMLQGLSKQVLLPYLVQLFPLLISSMLCEDVSLQLATMLTLGELTHDAPDLVAKHVDDLIPGLLKLTKYMPSMKVRIAALRCIKQLIHLPIHVVIPQKSLVLRSLATVLNDKKRLVRQEAASARNEWFLMDTSKE